VAARGAWAVIATSATQKSVVAVPFTAEQPTSKAVVAPKGKDEDITQFSLSLRKSLRKQLASLAASSDMTMRAFVLNALKEKGATMIWPTSARSAVKWGDSSPLDTTGRGCPELERAVERSRRWDPIFRSVSSYIATMPSCFPTRGHNQNRNYDCGGRSWFW
jgi:hypothetical protein